MMNTLWVDQRKTMKAVSVKTGSTKQQQSAGIISNLASAVSKQCWSIEQVRDHDQLTESGFEQTVQGNPVRDA